MGKIQLTAGWETGAERAEELTGWRAGLNETLKV